MQPPGTSSQGMRLFSILFLGVFGLVHLSTAYDLSTRQSTEGLYDSSEPILRALELASLHSRSDSDNTSSIVINDRPTEPDATLLWEVARGKGGNLVKLLDSAEPSQCGVEQSNFTAWKQLSDNGWIKQYQGPPKDDTKGEGERSMRMWEEAAKALKFSTDDQKNIQYTLEQGKDATIDGKDYRSSGGLYSNVINTDGAIFTLENTSPRTRGATQKPPLNGTPGNELVPLQSWADVSFLQLVDACKGDEKCVKGLKLIVKCHPENNVTNRIATQALGGSAEWKEWPGRNFSKKSLQFVALMATPSGQGVAWLLLTHREQLGWKSVESIDVWSENSHDSEQTLYAFNLKDQADSKQPSTRLVRNIRASISRGRSSDLIRTVRRDDQANGSSIIYDDNKGTHGYNELYQSDHNYDPKQAEAVGGYLAGLMQISLNRSCVQQSKWKFSDLKDNGWTSFAGTIGDSKALDGLNKVLSDAKLPKEKDGTKRITWKHDTEKTINGKSYPATHAEYDAVYSKYATLVLGVSNPVRTQSEDGDKDKTSPPLKTLSDILWLQWEDWCKSQKIDVTALTYIVMDGTANPSATQAIEHVLAGKKAGSHPGTVFGTDSKELAILLASPQGQGVVWMLSQHKARLGTKTVKNCRVWDDQGQVNLVVELADFSSANKTKTWQRSDDRDTGKALAKRVNDERPWDEWVAKGNSLLQMLQCGSGPSSTFESYDDLEKWGWERMEHEHIDQFKKPLIDAMDYLEVGSMKDQAWSITEKHTKLKVVDGKRYAPTQGSYGLTYTAEFISADNNWGPRSEGPDQVPQVDGVYLPFPLLEKLSNVAFLVFQQLMKETNQPTDRLKGLLRSGVVNTETLFVTTNALRLEPNAPHPAWPGRDFGPLSEGFAALLASPNGRGVAWFLAQHKTQLGHKTISNIRVWGEKDEVFILFVFEDVSESDENETSAEEVPPQELSLIQASGKDKKAWEAIQCKLFGLFCISKVSSGQRDLEIVSRGEGDPQPLPLPQFPNRKKPKVKIDWDRWVDKGKSYQELLRCGLKDSKWKSYDDLANNGWRMVQELGSVKIYDNGGMRKAMDFLKISSKSEDQWSVAQQHLVEKTIDGKTYFPTAAMYDNKYNMELITADNNFGPRYKGPEQVDPSVTGDPNLFPELQQLSDVMYLEFARLMTQSKNPLNKLKGVLRGHVINAETRAIAANAVGLSAAKLHDKSLSWPGRDFDAGSDEFAALIASPNGRAVVWLLATHADLGPKTISSVKVYDDEGLWILYVFEDREVDQGGSADDKNSSSTRKGLIAATQEPSTNDTTSGRRDSVFSLSLGNDSDHSLARRLDEPESQKVNDARCSGRFLVMAQDSSTEILESCLNIKQSTFVQSEQLGDSGWKLLGDHEATFDEDSDAAMFSSWHDMNLDLSANANHAIEYQHLEKTIGMDGTVYYPSGACYKNVFSEGGIAAKDNASPWKTGANMNPPVDGKTKLFPPLKQWSDAVFLAYKDVCKSDPMKMKKLKGCLRHNVINIAARQILSEYMGKHGELDSGRPKPWPGTMYKLDEDGFNVALGVPNGKGVAYLLATHRESLGWKEIYQIRIFSVGWESSYNILYYIRDHKEDAQRRHALSEVALTRTVQSRALSDEAYEKARNKGSNLLCQLYASASGVKGSIWKDPQALEDYGWVASEPEYKWEYNAPDNDIGPALKDLGVSTDAFENIKYGYWHQKESQHDGHTYPATFGFYQNVFNVKAGVIIADSNFGPDYEKKFGTTAETVPLKQYSDVVFLAWQKQAGDNIKSLKYVFRHKIVNSATQDILNAVLEKRNEKLKTWPGTKISMIESDARAILGTSNGHGVAYLLAQHKEQLDVKVIDSVTIFESDHLMSLCFWIVDEDDGGASLQPSRGSAVGSRELHERALQLESEHQPDLLPLKAYSAWTKVLARHFSKVAEACWAAFRVA